MPSILIGICTVIHLLFPSSAQSAAIGMNQALIISSPITENAYLAAGRIIINAALEADGILAGGSLLINAPVGRDLLAAGGDITINAPVEGNVRAVGGNITVNGRIAGDLVVAGGRVVIGPGVRISGDLLVAGGDVVIDGIVEGDLLAAGGEITFTGEVSGKARFRGEKMRLNGRLAGPVTFAAREVQLGSSALFAAEVVYWHPEGEIDFGPSLAPAVSAVYDPDLQFAPKAYPLRETGRRVLLVGLIFSVVSGTFFLLLATLLAPGLLRLAGERLENSFWPKTGLGFLYFLVTPPLALFLIVIVIGLPIGVFLLFVYIFSFIFATPLSAAVLARRLERSKRGDWRKWKVFLAGLGIFIVLHLLLLIPVVGWVIVFIPVCAAFGALLSADWQLVRAAPLPPAG